MPDRRVRELEKGDRHRKDVEHGKVVSEAVREPVTTTSRMSSMGDELDSFFRKFDEEFKAFEEAEAVVYRTSKLLVIAQVDVPVPMSKESEVKISFSTTQGDIAFSIHFITQGIDSQLETVFESKRVPSDTETYEGSFTAKEDGTLLLLFDNSFSYFTSKYLSYTIKLLPPSREIFEKRRTVKGQALLANAVEDIYEADDVLADAKQEMQQIKIALIDMDKRAKNLREAIVKGRQKLDVAYREADVCAAKIDAAMAMLPGICIRCLNKFLLTNVLAFVGPQGKSVCRYWHSCSNADVAGK